MGIGINVRINKITIRDVKSVTHGVIHFDTADDLRNENASIMGIYGQNGSGKTAVVEMLDIVKHIFRGDPIPSKYLELIAKGKDACVFKVELVMFNVAGNLDLVVSYECKLESRRDPNSPKDKPKDIIAITYEKLSFNGGNLGEYTIADEFIIAETDETCDVLLPTSNLALSLDIRGDQELIWQKKLALFGGRSFVFSDPLEDAIKGRSDMFLVHSTLLLLSIFSLSSLFVINEPQGNEFIFHTLIGTKTGGVLHTDQISLSGNVQVLSKSYIVAVEKSMPTINAILSSIIPGLKIDLLKNKLSLLDKETYEVEFIVSREGLGTFPLRNESLGIKKIISFLSLFIHAYNTPSAILVVDEMDASIFEYLLGDLLEMFALYGKGQLIFTSHNLRPLEKLNDKSICFTTTDPSNRYTQLTTKEGSNLRNEYFRAIALGTQDAELYNGKNKHTLAHALSKAGRVE